MSPEDINKWYVRNATGGMVPFSSFATGSWTYGSPKLERYNGISSVEIQGAAAPGKSTGQAMAAIEAIAAKREYTQDDNLHPTAAAQPLILDTVWKGLAPLLVKR